MRQKNVRMLRKYYMSTNSEDKRSKTLWRHYKKVFKRERAFYQ